MAKMYGLTGGLSGKMGNAVFRVREGQQIVTQYNPIVKNPNTQRQQNQRARFKLMAQLAAIMAPGFGTMAITKRPARGKPSQRNAFTQLNMPLVEVSSNNQEITAKIPMEQIQLTSSFRDLPVLSLTPAAGEIEISITGIATDVSAVRFVVVGYTGNVASIVNIIDYPLPSGGGNIATSIDNLASGQYTVLAYGLIFSESAKTSIDLDNIHTPADEDFISAVELNAMVAEGSMVETKTVGANVTLA